MAKYKKEGAIDSPDIPAAEEHSEVESPKKKVRIKATPVGQPEQEEKPETDEPMEIKAKPLEGEETPEEEDLEAGKPKLEYKGDACPKCGASMKEGACKECGYQVKGAMGGENPEESASAGTNAEHSTSPNMGVPSTQHVFVPTSGIKVSRDQPKYPNEVQLKTGTIDMTKSPLFVEMSKQINAMSKALTTKIEAVEKSYNDRLSNLQKTLDKFYAQPFYKSIGEENVGAEAILKKTISEQIAKGKVEFRGA